LKGICFYKQISLKNPINYLIFKVFFQKNEI